MTTQIKQLADGELQGPWRTPFNIAAQAEGSIHNDETARTFGLDGGWIAGSIHMEQFVPLFIERFGLAWLETGGFSVYFKQATLSGQKVRASLIDLPDDRHTVKLIMHDSEQRVVCEGQAWLGDRPAETVLRERLARFGDSEIGPVLNQTSVGAGVANVPSRITRARLEKDRPNVSEPIEAYETGVLPPNLAVDALRAVETELITLPENVVGLYGGIELQMCAGPILAATDYSANGKILALGQTPRTEVLFYESELFEGATLTARMIMMSRIMSAPGN